MGKEICCFRHRMPQVYETKSAPQLQGASYLKINTSLLLSYFSRS